MADVSGAARLPELNGAVPASLGSEGGRRAGRALGLIVIDAGAARVNNGGNGGRDFAGVLWWLGRMGERFRYMRKIVVGDAPCNSCVSFRSCLFSELRDQEPQLPPFQIKDILLAHDISLYLTDDSAEFIYFIRQGFLKLERRIADGTTRIVCILGKGHISGLESLVTGVYEQSATSLSPTIVCQIPKALVLELMPQLHGPILKKWHDVTLKIQECLREFSTGSAKQKVARLFLLLDIDKDGRCQLFGRENVGALLGISEETASRIIADMKRNRIVCEVSQNIFERNIPELRSIATGKKRG